MGATSNTLIVRENLTKAGIYLFIVRNDISLTNLLETAGVRATPLGDY